MAESAHPSLGWRDIAATSIDGVGVIEDGEYVFANDALAEIHGYADSDAITGSAWNTLYRLDEPMDGDDELLARVRAADEWQGEASAYHDDSGTVPVELSTRQVEAGIVCVVRDGHDKNRQDRVERTVELERYETIVETVGDGVYVLDENLEFSFVNDALCEMLGRSRDELQGTSVMDFFIFDDQRAFADEMRERVMSGDISTGVVEGTTTTSDGETLHLEARYRLHPEPDGEFQGSVGILRDITERKDHERELQRQRDELETLNRINKLLLEVTQDLVETPTRDAIEQTVCERLAESELYQFAWIGEPETNGDHILPRASAGIDDGYVESVTITTADAETGRGPGGRALRTGEVQVSQDIRTDSSFEPWRDAALDRGIQSAAAVPLIHGDTTYGLLAVYATRPLAFSQREQEGFETLGKAVGFAINAIENRNLLFADTVVELEFEVTDPGLVFVRASEQLDCELTVTGYVASETGDWSVYLSVEDASPTAVQEITSDDHDVERVRVIADDDDEGLVEFVMNGPALNEITNHGAMITSGHVDSGQGWFRIEVPQTTDIRRLVDRLQATYPESRLVAQRRFDRPVQKARELRQSFDDRLTERQKEALYRAYHAGYFEWPRTSTAGEIAESMDIAGTTLHYHLRNALDELLTVFAEFEGR
ncbi:bacterio-opsin activator domain-containing protein [Haladaptatus sp. NG-SE-30]